MTFSDPAVYAWLARDFVCAWVNSRPEVPAQHFRRLDEEKLRGWQRLYPQGTGAASVTMYFSTTDGRVLSHLEGFWAPGVFLREMHWVTAMRDRLTAGGIGVPEDVARAGVAEMHRRAIDVWRREVGFWGEGGGGAGRRAPEDAERERDADRKPVRPQPNPPPQPDPLPQPQPWPEPRPMPPLPTPGGWVGALVRFHEAELARPLLPIEQAMAERVPPAPPGG
ncbi:MAG: hypothetical protein HZA54_00770 [Planctomycetes bacterium]|nr:hypothetical protein [Planctomycetota bacterium]